MIAFQPTLVHSYHLQLQADTGGDTGSAPLEPMTKHKKDKNWNRIITLFQPRSPYVIILDSSSHKYKGHPAVLTMLHFDQLSSNIKHSKEASDVPPNCYQSMYAIILKTRSQQL